MWAQVLKDAHKEKRKSRCQDFLKRFKRKAWQKVCSVTSAVYLRSTLKSQNGRLYREVEFKTDLSEDELLVTRDTQQPGVMVMAAVSWYGKSSLYLLHRRNAKLEFMS